MSAPHRRRAPSLLSGVLLALLAACSAPDGRRYAPANSPPLLDGEERTVCALPGWNEDRHAEIMPALMASCAAIRRHPPASLVSAAGVSGSAADWLRFCDAAASVPGGNNAAARDFLERWLVVAPTKAPQSTGVLTGYHEVRLMAAEAKSKRFAYPIYALPKTVRVLPTRAQVSKGALKGLEILWLDSPVDGLWLELNGAGRAILPDGRRIMIEYAGQNGHSAKFITSVMAEHGVAPTAKLTRDFVRDWAKRNPKMARRLINENPSMVFFRIRSDAPEGPRGALGVPLTAGRSIAIDPRHVPLGTLAWVEGGHVPALGKPFRRLMTAQDTGGAIKGPSRGDVFWGLDEGDVAPRFKITGRIIQLAPRSSPLPTAGCVGSPGERIAQVEQTPASRPE